MSKLSKSGLAGKLTRREFFDASVKIGLGVVGTAVVGVGCGPEAATPTPTKPVATPTAVPKKPYALECWQISQGPAFDKVMKAAIKEFEDTHPNIKVNLSVEPYKDMNVKVFPVFTSGGPGPDVLMTGAAITITLGKMPFGFIDIANRIQAAGMMDKIPARIWETMQEKGKVFGIPFDCFLYLLHYNKDLYEAAGITRAPETEEDLLKAARKIYDPAKDRFGFLVFTTFPAWPLEQLWYNRGVGYFEGSEDFRQYDTTKPITMTRPEAVAALEYLRSLAETAPGGLAGNIGVGTADADVKFAKGNLGHFYTHTIHTSQIEGYNPKMVPRKNFDVMTFPKGSKRRGQMFSSSVFGISKLSKDPDAAWEFVKFLSDQWEGRIAPSIGTVPCRQDAKVDETAVGSWLVPIGRQLLAGEIFSQATFPQVEAFAVALRPNVEAYFLGKKTALQALEDAAAEGKKALTG